MSWWRVPFSELLALKRQLYEDKKILAMLISYEGVALLTG